MVGRTLQELGSCCLKKLHFGLWKIGLTLVAAADRSGAIPRSIRAVPVFMGTVFA